MIYVDLKYSTDLELCPEAAREHKKAEDIGDAFQVGFWHGHGEECPIATKIFGKQAVVNSVASFG
jgi:hypothetical protein